MEKIKIIHIELLQAFAIITVFLGHALRIYHSEGWYFHKAQVNLYCDVADKVIYSFHMPLFVFLSGYLFYANIDKIKSLGQYAIKRAKRLLVPFLFMGLLFVLPLICIIDPLEKNVIFYYKNFLNFKQCWHLWFLPMLFCVNIIFATLFVKIKNINKLFLCFILILLNIFKIKGAQSCFYNIPTYLIYFYLGCLFFEYKNIIKEKISKYLGLIGFILIFSEIFLYNYNFKILSLLTAVSCILFLYLSSLKITKGNASNNYAVTFLSNNLFILYLLHEPILALILKYLKWGSSYSPLVSVNILFWLTLIICILVIIFIKYLKTVFIKNKYDTYFSNP